MKVDKTSVRRCYTDVGLGQIHYRQAGEGAPVVLLHKNPSSSIMYEPTLPLFADRGYHVIAMDTPGYGMSDGPEERPGDVAFYSDAVVSLLDALGIEKASMLGHHTGATIALDLAANHPDRVDNLVLVGALALKSVEEGEEWFKFVKPFDLDTNGDFLELYPLPVFRDNLVFVDGEHFLRELTAALQAGPNYWWAYEAIFSYVAYDVFPRVECPTLFLNAIDDEIVFESTKEAQPHVRRSVYTEVPGTSEVTVEYPTEFVEAVVTFLGNPGV